jgi:polysaccharide pyruvyl transferase WcaK-like protein
MTPAKETRRAGEVKGRPGDEVRTAIGEPAPRIALLTPYTGGNLGDAAIQDAMVGNLRVRLPGAQFSGISLNCENFLEQHGTDAFPLCGVSQRYYGMTCGTVAELDAHGGSPAKSRQRGTVAILTGALKKIPPLWWLLKRAQTCWREVIHSVKGYLFLRTQNLLIVSGGGQLTEECGGPWGQPFALFKWAFLARVARVPCAITSVGAGKVVSRTGRLFLSATFRLVQYRSYRDTYSRSFAASLMRSALEDPVVPDVALSLRPCQLPRPVGIRQVAKNQRIVAVSPICYAKPSTWPTLDQDRELYRRYVGQMAEVVCQLLLRGYFLVMVWSSLWDDEGATSDIVACLDRESRERFNLQTYVPKITSWTDVVATLIEVDLLIASRLHSAVLGFVSATPTVAISFHPKVDRIMQDLGQVEFLLHIRDFTAQETLKALDRLMARRDRVKEQIASYLRGVAPVSALQYDNLAQLAREGGRRGYSGRDPLRGARTPVGAL